MTGSSSCLGGALAVLFLVACAPDKTDPGGAGDPTGTMDMAGGGGGGGDGGASPQLCPAGNIGPGQAPNGTIPGALAFPFPTIRNLTVVWDISGDDNANGVVELRYRKAGE